jgi:hypothetical protein
MKGEFKQGSWQLAEMHVLELRKANITMWTQPGVTLSQVEQQLGYFASPLPPIFRFLAVHLGQLR